MVPGLHWLMRMKRWQQNPPSARQFALFAGVILLCFAIFAVERWVGWPDWMTADRIPRVLR